jgi:natural product biosynthesis luciferase-like monooxygenase protein
MKFATFALSDNIADRPPREVLDTTVRQAVLAEELGFDAVWLAEHHFSDYGVAPSTAVLAAAIATRTEHIRIGTGVLVLPFHDPIGVAEQWAMVDQLSGGRLDFGVGRGYQPGEFAGYGVPMAEARERFTEALEIIEGLWSHESFSYHGKYRTVENVRLNPPPLQRPTPPIWMAAVSRESFENAARARRPVMSAPSIALDAAAACFDLYRSTLEEVGGSAADSAFPIQRHVHVGVDDKSSVKTVEGPYMRFLNRNAELMLASKDQVDASYKMYQRAAENKAKIEFREIAANPAFLVGSADTVVHRIKSIREAIGLNYLLGCFQFGGLEPHFAEQAMRRFANDVIPAFR